MKLQHSGTLALVDILHSGFPHRLPLRPLAAHLRTALGPLVQKLFQEQVQKVQQLLAQKEQQQNTDGNSASFDSELTLQRRMLETLRHCNPTTARDRTLGNEHKGQAPIRVTVHIVRGKVVAGRGFGKA